MGKDLTAKMPFLQIEGPSEITFALYSYLSLPAVAILDLNQTSIRLTSVFAGILLVLFVYLFSKEFSKKILPEKAEIIGLLSALILAISPWNIFFSRFVSQENLSLSLFVLGSWLLLKNKYFIVTLIIFILSMLSWEGALVLVPVLIVIYHLLIPDNSWGKKLIGSLILVELFCLLFTNQFQVIFRDSLFYNAHDFNLPKKILTNFLDYFSAEYLFFLGDYRLKYWLTDIGVIYLFFLPFFLWGFLFLFNLNKKISKFLISWIILIFLYAASGFNMRDVQRSLWASVPIHIIIAFGVYHLFMQIQKTNQNIFKLIFFGLLFACFYNTLLSYHFYFVHFPKKEANEPEYAFQETGHFLAKNYQNYDKILIDSKYGNLYLYLLFYMKYSPHLYVSSDKKPDQFGKFTFGRVFKDNFDHSQKTLLIIDQEKNNLPQEMKLEKITNLTTLNQDTILSAWETK
jgi:hypothetical protein